MSIETYLLYLGVLAAFFATPPDTSQLLIISNSLRHGMRRSMATVAGDLSANALQMTLAAFGLTAVIAASADALWVVKWLGVAYLVWIGLKLMLSKGTGEAPAEARHGRLFRQGFVTSSANPYAVVFFGALFPQFIPADSGPHILALLVATFVVVKLVILGGYAIGARHVVRLLRKPDHARAGQMLTGVIFVGFGLLMIWSALTAG